MGNSTAVVISGSGPTIRKHKPNAILGKQRSLTREKRLNAEIALHLGEEKQIVDALTKHLKACLEKSKAPGNLNQWLESIAAGKTALQTIFSPLIQMIEHKNKRLTAELLDEYANTFLTHRQQDAERLKTLKEINAFFSGNATREPVIEVRGIDVRTPQPREKNRERTKPVQSLKEENFNEVFQVATRQKAAPKAQPRRSTAGYIPPSRVGKSAVIGYFDPEIVSAIKSLASENELTVQELIEAGIAFVFERAKKPELAAKTRQLGAEARSKDHRSLRWAKERN